MELPSNPTAPKRTIPTILSADSQEGILRFFKSCSDLTHAHWNLREQMRGIDLAYNRELDLTVENLRAKVANKYGDPKRIQNLNIPIIKPQVESAVAYQASVFLSGSPIFGCVAAAKYEDAALQMETILSDQSERGGWILQLSQVLRDGFKYNLGAAEVAWEEVVSVSTDPTKRGEKEIIWSGNSIKRIDLYNAMFDTRVSPTDIPAKGEFAGHTELLSRIALKQKIESLETKIIANLKRAYESGTSNSTNFYSPIVNWDAIMNRNIRASTNWESWFSGGGNTPHKIAYQNQFEVTTMYGRILPSDFGINAPAPNTPQVWKLIIINSQVLIYAERLTNSHNLLPMLFIQPYCDGLDYQTKSLAQDVRPLQEISNALGASAMEARRRAISDRTLYDPARIRPEDINSDNPSAKIPVRGNAYGKALHDAVYAFPFRDDQSQMIFQQLPILSKYADIVTGQNQAQQGQFVKGNKTQHEYSDVMGHANARQQTVSIVMEAQFFTPLKTILKTNILQFQGGVTLLNKQKGEMVEIDPVTLQQAVLAFKVTDGLTPADKLIASDSFQTALQVFGSAPQIAAEYEVGDVFSYLMKTQGADIAQFQKSPQKKQYEQAVSQWQQTVMQLAKESPEIKPEQYPPQPTPQQFGIGPDGKPLTTPQQQEKAVTPPTLMEQVMAANQEQQ